MYKTRQPTKTETGQTNDKSFFVGEKLKKKQQKMLTNYKKGERKREREKTKQTQTMMYPNDLLLIFHFLPCCQSACTYFTSMYTNKVD